MSISEYIQGQLMELRRKLLEQSTSNKNKFLSNFGNISINPTFLLERDIDNKDLSNHSDLEIEEYIGNCFRKFEKIFYIDTSRITKKTLLLILKVIDYRADYLP